jgi:hypothetical protein
VIAAMVMGFDNARGLQLTKANSSEAAAS